MQDKQKVTLYLPQELHRQLKIKSALDAESMSALVEKAVQFYMVHPEQVEEAKAKQGKTYQVHICPECTSPVVMKDGNLVSLKNQPTIIEEEEFPLMVKESVSSGSNSPDEGELVRC